jgi:hypothetical protein
MTAKRVTLLTALFFMSWLPLMGQDHQMPEGMTHEQHLKQMQKKAELKKRGNAAMGFDQDKTTHHFLLTKDGGIIQVEANDTSDVTSRDQIRTHLKTISEQFAAGNFSAPFATHNEVPPGVPIMQRLSDKIHYVFEERPNGGAVRIRTADRGALKAVHDFLRYQIREHSTRDSMSVGN